jgi:hypothetical protein
MEDCEHPEVIKTLRKLLNGEMLAITKCSVHASGCILCSDCGKHIKYEDQKEIMKQLKPKKELAQIEVSFGETEDEELEKNFGKKTLQLLGKIAAFLRILDFTVFPDNPLPIGVRVERTKYEIEEEATLYYQEKEEGAEESYVLLVESVRELVEDPDFFGSYPTEELFLIGLAVHEIRHRVQHNSNIDLFTPDLNFKDEIPQYITDEKKRDIENTTRNFAAEFDASWIETYVDYFLISTMDNEIDYKRIAEAIKMVPGDLEKKETI